MGRDIILLVVGVISCAVLSGCGSDSGPLSPTVDPPIATPAPQPTPAPQGTYTVSGVVSEAADDQTVPLEGVHVEDSERHYSVKTGPDGSYTIPDARAGNAYFYFVKEGFRSQVQQFILASDTRLDIQLVRQ
jgi:Carboxypeptidase regulatory-like domain